MDEPDRGVEAPLEIAQEAEDRGDVGDSVLVDAVETDQRVEDHEARPDALYCLLQPLTVVAQKGYLAVLESERRKTCFCGEPR